ncbi:kinase domain protein (macronuclear) [Tetrahymena thermophila SB210]|uniref:Kinase domain protein n=1 Tax=Tetrahymena thermophila (strain SB210) TaxID=312017 RepID=W7XDN2_TETTS|nr:kinase domain protein [Tetrahymena thermophila SB210]EWS74763.1 kinase domain protein [Tetrahymena thermophila SB210]|eukprot:XP_012652764.1 kinase domain protein [Tetrahymena thermophila SB210]
MARQNNNKSNQLKKLKLIQSNLSCSQNKLSLFLDYYEISEDIAIILGQVLQYNEKISKLEMSFRSSYIGHLPFNKLISSLANFTNLKSMTLDLYNNQILAEGAYQLSLVIENFKIIETLNIDLRRNNIGDSGLFKLASSLQNCKNLSTLIFGLKSNNIQGKSIIKSFSALAQIATLKTLTLDLSKNNINASCAIDICSELVKNKTVQNLEIDFSENCIGNLGLFGMSQHLLNSTQIQSLVLKLSNIKITDEGLQCLANPLFQGKNNRKLALDIQKNQVSQQSVSDLISCIGKTQIEDFKFNFDEMQRKLDQSCLGFDKSQFANLISLDIRFGNLIFQVQMVNYKQKNGSIVS